MIRLHNSQTGKPVYIDPQAIDVVLVDEDGVSSMVLVRSGVGYIVRESLTDITLLRRGWTNVDHYRLAFARETVAITIEAGKPKWLFDIRARELSKP
jgi:hypothetical protein